MTTYETLKIIDIGLYVAEESSKFDPMLLFIEFHSFHFIQITLVKLGTDLKIERGTWLVHGMNSHFKL